MVFGGSGVLGGSLGGPRGFLGGVLEPILAHLGPSGPNEAPDLVQKNGTDNCVIVGDYDKRFAHEPFSVNTSLFACHSGAKAACFAENASKAMQ